MQRDHMMGWVMPAEPLGPAIRPIVATKEGMKKFVAEMAVHDFETGDHMLPGMKQSDFPKEYDTRVAIEDRSMAAYDRAVREMLVYGTGRVKVGYDAGAPEGDRTVVAKLTKEKCDDMRRLVDEWTGMPKNWELKPKAKSVTATEIALKMEAEIHRKMVEAYRPGSRPWAFIPDGL